ncbi:hypothetical protein N7454_008701 [Penicillium verhagenii]|nr:hypothetical protein N7454_008701 [Penicillium verhagenii]
MAPTIMGINEASKGTRDHEEHRRESARKQRCHLSVQCTPIAGSLEQRFAIHNAMIYLGPDGKIYTTKSPSPQLVPLNGGFYQHPDLSPGNAAGFVTITDPRDEMGGRKDSEGNICGPFDWTQDEERITLHGWEGWLAVHITDKKRAKELCGEDCQDVWRLHFDENDDGADLAPGTEVVEVTIKRTVAIS